MELLGKIHASQWATAKAYFNTPANIHAVKLSRHVIATLGDVKAKPRLHSFIKINNSIYAMSNQDYLGSGSYGAVKIIQNEAGENFALKIEQISADSDLVIANIKKALELKILKKIKDPHSQKYLKGYRERYFDPKKSKNKEIQKDHIEIRGHRQIIGKRYTVTSLIQGQDLSKHPEMNVYHPIPNAVYYDDNFICTMEYFKRLHVALQITKALKSIHERGILHGDFKPSNLMYFESQEGISIFPVDYGMSFLLKRKGFFEKLTRKKRSTPPLESKICARHYRAPEVSLGNRITKASDIYSLGVILGSDLELPHHLSAPLIAENPNDRPSCEGIIKMLKAEIALINTESKVIAERIDDVFMTYFSPFCIQTSFVNAANQLLCRFSNLTYANNDRAYYAIKNVFTQYNIVLNDEGHPHFAIDLYANRHIFTNIPELSIIHQKIQNQLRKMSQASDFFTRIAAAKRELSALPSSCAIFNFISKKDLKAIYHELKGYKLEIEEQMWEMGTLHDIPILMSLKSPINISITYREGDFALLIKPKPNLGLPDHCWQIDTTAPTEYTIEIPRGLTRSPKFFNIGQFSASLAEIESPIGRLTHALLPLAISASSDEYPSNNANVASSSIPCSSSTAPVPFSFLSKPNTLLLRYSDSYSSFIDTEKENQYLASDSHSSSPSIR